jgi:serine/tyrosine/threonine adenylyltransferase
LIYSPDPKILSALPEGMWDIARPASFPKKVLRFRNDSAAREVGLEAFSEEDWLKAFALFEPLDRNLTAPLALRYHGHQFGVYNPQLGDGRGFLFAQLRDDRGRLLDLATKGSGTTPWSRGGDGRLTLKGGIREVLAAEMLESLGVPTSRAFSLFETGEKLMRGDEPSPTRSSVLVRLGHSHIRFGTFQRLARLKEEELMKRLVDFCVEAYYPELADRSGEDRVMSLLESAAQASAMLAARWMAAGFVHGVLNTDNMTITGESFDYGPWRFVPDFDPDFVAAYFDGTGLYAFGRQPAAVEWNVARLADALRLIAPSAPLGSVVATFAERYEHSLRTATLDRLGVVASGDQDIDDALAKAVWAFLDSTGCPFERFFFDHFGGPLCASFAHRHKTAKDEHYEGPRHEAVMRLLEAYAPNEAGRQFDREGPCTMLIDELEAIWDPIAYADDFRAFESKIIDIRDMGVAYGFRRSVA